MRRLDALSVVGSMLSLLLMPGAEPVPPCSAGTTLLNVTTTVELQNMINTINCTGEGTFEATWTGSLQLGQTIELSGNKTLTVTGSRPVLSVLPSAVVDAGSTTGIFSVFNGSTLNLNNLLLQGGVSEFGAAVDARISSSVHVASCAFTNNNATTGGAIFAFESELHIEGDTVFADNSAQYDGGAIYAQHSELQIDGSITFANNSAGEQGGAVFASNSATFITGGAVFVHNKAGGDGGAISVEELQVYLDGYASFESNAASVDGGAVNARDSEIRIFGDTSYFNNSCGNRGGAIHSLRSNVSVDGVTSFTSNSAIDTGGAIFGRSTEIIFSGDSSFVDCSSVLSTGGAFHGNDVKFHVEGKSLFANNSAFDKGGAIMTFKTSETYITGNTSFVHNSAGDQGGAIGVVHSILDMEGDIFFGYNSATTNGGCIFSGGSPVRIRGQLWFGYNSAASFGGVLYAFGTPIYIEGNTTFSHNTAGQGGGALYGFAELVLSIVGFTVFSHNSAIWRGGAITVLGAESSINGSSLFQHNRAYDGGAIVAHQSPLNISGSARFLNNSAEQDGGAINILGSNVTIEGEVELSSNTALNGGGIYSTLSPSFDVMGTISFVGNHAIFFGGAISVNDPIDVHIIGARFESNTGTSGGAVFVSSVEPTTGGLERCRFDGNSASNGGALFLSADDAGVPEKPRFVRDSVFLHNTAAELGGAIYIAGAWEVTDTVFSENTAEGGGLAIHEAGSSLELWNTTFYGNVFSCPTDQYSDARHDAGGTCRFEVVCQRCSEGCEVDQRIATVSSDTVPVCEDIPEGVVQPSMTTLGTFDLLEGYYRVSNESRVIRECYQAEACSGGADHLNYCAEGYTGPYCAVCADGYAPGVMNLCHECSTENRRWTVGLVTAALVLGIFVAVLVVFHILKEAEGGAGAACPQPLLSCYKVLAKALPLSAIKIVVVVLQIITQFTEIAGAVYPEQYEAFLSKMTSINLDIGFILSNSCLVKTDFYDKLLLATIGPLVVLSVLFGTLFVARRRRNTTDETAEPLLQSKRASAGLFIVFFVYSSVSFTIFQTFVCDDLDDGTSYLRADYSLVCSSDKHAAYLTYASIMVCVYPVGIPAFFAWWLGRNRRDLEKPAREDMVHLESFSGLWAAYRPSCYYYEVVECFRRIALTGAAVFVLPNSAEQIAVIFLLAVVFTFISESLSPFEGKADMWLYRWGSVIILGSMYVALLLKVELADEESHASSVMTALLIAGNVFLILMVTAQGVFLMKGLYMSTRAGGVRPSTSV